MQAIFKKGNSIQRKWAKAKLGIKFEDHIKYVEIVQITKVKYYLSKKHSSGSRQNMLPTFRDDRWTTLLNWITRSNK